MKPTPKEDCEICDGFGMVHTEPIRVGRKTIPCYGWMVETCQCVKEQMEKKEK